MKTNFGLKKLVEDVQKTREGKFNLLHMCTEMSIYDGLVIGGKDNVSTQSTSTQK